MSGDADIEKVLLRLGIVAKKKGREWEALCPNPDHADRSPSWRIKDEPGATKHGYHHCWPCGFGGSLLDLIQKVLGLEDYKAAQAWLGQSGIVEQKEVVGVEIQVRPPQLRFKLPQEVRFGPLEAWPGPARDYLARRGIEAWQVEKWGIGYAVEGRLRGRIVFVLRDAKGRPQSYSSRTFIDEGKRFLEPADVELASPAAMFGEQHWDKSRHAVFVFEGAIKALAAEAALPGANVAATTGSELRLLHPTKLSTFAHVCLVGDDDPAGNKISSQLATQLARHASCERLVLRLDADELPRDELGGILLSWLRGRR